MAKLSIKQGTTSKMVDVFIQDSSSTTGAGLTGLTNASAGLTAYYYREGASSPTAISLTSATAGTFTSGGFVVIDGTNMPGWYQLGVPDAALASGAKSVKIHLKGATNMAPLPLEIELTAWDNQDSVRGGLSALPAAPLMVKKNQAFNNFPCLLISSTDHVSPKTGLTVTAQRSIDGGAFSACANAVSELGNGIYLINLAASDVNGGVITLLFTASGADSRYVTIVTQA